MTRSRFTLLASALLTTACGQLLDASPDGLSFGGIKPPLNNLCNEGGSSGAANSAGSGGRAGQAGSISTTGGSAGASAGKGGAGGQAGSGGFAGVAGSGGLGGEGGGSGEAGSGGLGGESGQAGSGMAGGGGASAGSGTTSPYDTVTSTEFTPFQQTPLTGVVGDLTVVPTGPTSFQVFARDATTLLISTASYSTKSSWDSSLWTELLIGKVDSNPAAAIDGFASVLHVFARQGQPIMNFFQPIEEDAWVKQPVNDPSVAQVTSAPAATRRTTSKSPQVFVVSAQGTLLMGNAENKTVTTWQNLGSGLAPESAPAVVRDDDGGIDILARMANDTLSRCRLQNGQSICFWQPWPGVTLDTSPAVASWASGRLDVVVRDTTSGELRYRALREDGTLAPGWTPLPAVTSVGAPSAVALSLGKLRVLVHDGDGKVFMASLKP